MADTRLVLGGITFRDFEIPDRIVFGNKHSFKVHKLIGGQRVVDAMGPDPEPIQWSGRFRGADAISRARRVEALSLSGARVRLSWSGFSYLVGVEHFTADFEKFYEIPYRITCLVIQHPRAYAASVSAVVSTVTSVVRGDVSAIVSTAAGMASR